MEEYHTQNHLFLQMKLDNEQTLDGGWNCLGFSPLNMYGNFWADHQNWWRKRLVGDVQKYKGATNPSFTLWLAKHQQLLTMEYLHQRLLTMEYLHQQHIADSPILLCVLSMAVLSNLPSMQYEVVQDQDKYGGIFCRGGNTCHFGDVLLRMSG